jgi:heat shock protein HslJ
MFARTGSAGVAGSCRLAALAVVALLMAGSAGAEADGPDWFAVTGVSANDVLNIRAAPDAASQKVGAIPPDADGVKNLGCKGGLTFAEWEKATDAERKAAERKRWCRISYKGQEGWVAGSYLREGSAPANDAAGAGTHWRIVEVGGVAAAGEAGLMIGRDGQLSGSTGCNRFSGSVKLAEGRLEVSPLAATRMACPEPAMRQEGEIFGILTGAVRFEFDPLSDRLTLTGADGRTIVLERRIG